MAIHKITTARDDFYTGSAGLSEDQLRASFAVLSNDPLGARLWSVWPSAPHALAASSSSRPKSISIVDGGVTYTGLISIAGGRAVVDFSQSSTAINALNAGDVLTGSFYYVDRLTGGRFSSAKVTFTIRGLNDSATIAGTSAGVVTEDVTLMTGGTLTVNDPDAGENLFQNPASLAGVYGTFTFNAATGVWGYTLDNTAPHVQSLDGADTVFDTFTVTSLDGSASQTISVSINGDDDDATISGTATGSVAEDGANTASGTLTVTDPDAGENAFQAPASLDGTYGDFTFDPVTGDWDYTLRNDDANVQGLIGTDEVTDTLTVSSWDGTDSETIIVTITGADDAATISGTATGSVAEDGASTASGTLTVTDPDGGENVFVAPELTSFDGTYGDFTFDPVTGEWGYALRNGDANVQGLIGTDEVTDTLTVSSWDGTASEEIMVTITGADDQAEIGGTNTGEVTEDGTDTASGKLTVTDPDAGENVFAAASLVGAYGDFTFDPETGEWDYALRNGDASVQGLTLFDVVTETLSVTSFDGSDTEEIIVTITGADDAATISGTATGSVTEDVTNTANGKLNISDPDNGEDAFWVPNSLAGKYGTFTFDAAGTWTYTLDDTNPNVDALNDAEILDDSLMVSSIDGTPSTINITIFGFSDNVLG